MASLKRSKTGCRVQWYDHTGKRRTHTLRTKSKRAAERFAGRKEQEAAERRAGICPPDELFSPHELIEDALTAYKAQKQAAQVSPGYIEQTASQIQKVADMAGWRELADISAEGMERVSAAMSERGDSARTVQAYTQACKGFCRWCARAMVAKLPSNPLIDVSMPNPDKHRRHKRRMLLAKEWAYLEPAAANGKPRYNLEGAERALLYAVAVVTGYRVGELAALTRSSLQRGPSGWLLQLDAEHCKNGEASRQRVPVSLAVRIQQHCQAKTPRAPIFNLSNRFKATKALRADLKDARAAWLQASKDSDERAGRDGSDFLQAENHRGEVLVFHSLRHTCGAWLAERGVMPKTIQAVMRHSTIKLTLDTYGHLMPGSVEVAADELAAVMRESAADGDSNGVETGNIGRRDVQVTWRDGCENAGVFGVLCAPVAKCRRCCTSTSPACARCAGRW